MLSVSSGPQSLAAIFISASNARHPPLNSGSVEPPAPVGNGVGIVPSPSQSLALPHRANGQKRGNTGRHAGDVRANIQTARDPAMLGWSLGMTTIGLNTLAA